MLSSPLPLLKPTLFPLPFLQAGHRRAVEVPGLLTASAEQPALQGVMDSFMESLNRLREAHEKEVLGE